MYLQPARLTVTLSLQVCLKSIRQLQLLQNTDGGVLTKTRGVDHIPPLLRSSN